MPPAFQEYRLQIQAVLEKVETACQFVADVAAGVGMQADAVHALYLSVEEICTNVIEHGYAHDGAEQVIDLTCRRYPDRLSVTISDDAPQFNPLELRDPDPSAPLPERRSGGWGMFFVKKYTDHITYEYAGNRNHLTVEKYI